MSAIRLRPPRHAGPLSGVRDGSQSEGGRGMKRRLFTLAAAVSLVLCMATVVLWLRSYNASDRSPAIGRHALESSEGRLSLVTAVQLQQTLDNGLTTLQTTIYWPSWWIPHWVVAGAFA